VKDELDREICKRVFRIRGSVSANNYLLLPGPRSTLKSLGLTGEYIYLQLKAVGGKFLLVHLDFIVATTSSFRISLSNMYTEEKVSYHSLQVPLVLSGWAVVCLHVPSALALCRRLPTHAFVLRSVQLCASIVVRNVFTSDNRYTLDTLPRDMRMDLQQGCGDSCAWIHAMSCQLQRGSDEGNPNLHSVNTDSSAGDSVRVTGMLATELSNRPRLPDPYLEVSRIAGVSRKTRKIADVPDLVPRRFAVFVCCGQGQEAVVWHGDGIAAKHTGSAIGVLYAASMSLITVHPKTGIQHCHFGHSQAVDVLEASDDGRWVASVQTADCSGPPLIRVWHVDPSGSLRCVSVLACPALASVHAAAFDPLAKYIAVAGTDLQGRQQLRVWDVARIVSGGNTSLLARQLSPDWDIDCLKFSPFEEMQLVSCGKNSIRFWRVKEDGHIPGRSAVLNSLGRQAHFTCIAFEFNKCGAPYVPPDNPIAEQRMFVGTSSGQLVQLSCKDYSVQAVFPLHDGAILGVSANESCVITASADKFVRVWPLDFKSFYLHAKHDSPVVGVDLSVDGLHVSCCMADGSVGVLDLQSHAYLNLAHSHGSSIADAAISQTFQELATVSIDGTVKIWSLESMAQTHEFCIAKDTPRVVEFHPSDKHLVAVGFESGTLRIFDIDALVMLWELQQDIQPILGLAFVKERESGGAHVVTCSAIGSLTLYAESCNFEPIHCSEYTPSTRPPEGCSAIACVPPYLLQYLDPHCVALFSFPTLDSMGKLRVQNSEICTLDLSFRGHFAVLGTSDSKVHLFDTVTGSLVVSYTLGASTLSAVALIEPFTNDANSSIVMPPVLIAATSDMLIRSSSLPNEAANLQRPRQREQALGVQPCATGVLVDEQVFIGHATAAHRILLSHNMVVTASPSEILCWTVRGDALELHFQFGLSQPDGNAEGHELIPPALHMTELGSQLVLNEDMDDDVVAATSPQGDLLDINQSENLPVASTVESDQDTQEPSKPPNVKLQPSSRMVSEDSRLHLLYLTGCAVLCSQQAFSWQPVSGFLCQIVGGVVQVEKLRTSLATSSREVSGAGATLLPHSLLVHLPGVKALAVDLEPSGRGLLAVLSAEAQEAGGSLSLSVWHLEDLACVCSRKLPSCYSVLDLHTHDSTESDAEDMFQCAAMPMLLMLGGGRSVVTAMALDSGRGGRVDVWGVDFGNCVLRCSAEVAQAPCSLALVSTNSSEFLTLCQRNVIFWRCPPEDCQTSELQFQVVEEPHGWAESTACMTSFCVMKLSTWNLLLIGTDVGHVWAHNADENQVLADLCIADGEPIRAISSAQWPFLVCAVGIELRSFTLEDDPQGCLQATQIARPVLLDGQIVSVQMRGSCAYEGVASTSANTLWYFHTTRGLRVQLHGFHSSPSRVLKSNAAWHLPNSSSNDARPPTAVVTGSDDGQIRLWSHGPSPSLLQNIAEFEGDSPCVAVSFLGLDLFAAAFLSGSVCLFSLQSLRIVSHLSAYRRDPLLVMEALCPSSLVLGSANGDLWHLRPPPISTAVGVDVDGSQWSTQPLPGSSRGAAICGLACDCDRSPRRLLACLSSLELRVFDCFPLGSCRPSSASTAGGVGRRQPAQAPVRLLRSWIWPERPPTHHTGHCGTNRKTEADYLELLSAPPIVATFVILQSGAKRTTDIADLVVVAAPPALCLYVFGCLQGTVMNRIDLQPSLAPVVRLWAPKVQRRPQARIPAADQSCVGSCGAGCGFLLVISRDQWSSLSLEGGGTRAQWLRQAQPLPAVAALASSAAAIMGGTPAVCPIALSTPAAVEGKKQIKSGGILLKSDFGLSLWEWSAD